MARAGILRARLRAIREKVVRRRTIWLDEDDHVGHADIVERLHFLSPIVGGGPGHLNTQIVDLSRDEEALWEELKKDTRKYVRRAEREGVVVSSDPDPSDAVLAAFVAAHALLEARKGLTPLDEARLRDIAARGMLTLSRSTSAEGEALSWHTFVAKGKTVRALQSVTTGRDQTTEERSFLGRAHRFHVWRDILDFKARGFDVYDNGGFHDGDDTAKRAISAFKAEFGGTIVPYYNDVRALTWRGRAALALASAWRRVAP